jgi:hypothetical protein
VQSWSGVIWLFRRLVVTNGNNERNRIRQRYGVGKRFRFWDWFRYYDRLRN